MFCSVCAISLKAINFSQWGIIPGEAFLFLPCEKDFGLPRYPQKGGMGRLGAPSGLACGYRTFFVLLAQRLGLVGFGLRRTGDASVVFLLIYRRLGSSASNSLIFATLCAHSSVVRAGDS